MTKNLQWGQNKFIKEGIDEYLYIPLEWPRHRLIRPFIKVNRPYLLNLNDKRISEVIKLELLKWLQIVSGRLDY